MNYLKISNDVNGNPRYVFHFLNFAKTYDVAIKLANKHIGGKKFNNKQYGGGIVVQSYNIDATIERIKQISLNK
jgi:hypothetical protein